MLGESTSRIPGHHPTLPLLLLLLLSFPVGGVAATHRVPAEYATIQEGIDACAVGDTVLVAAGTYTGDGNRNLRFRGVDLALFSDAGPLSTTIDCGMQGTGILFVGGESSEARVTGFTIRNATAGGILCTASDPAIISCRIVGNRPGGVLCNDASPTLQGCTISGNETTGSGGGIYCYTGSAPVITDCVISGNRAGGTGGGIYCSTSFPTIRSTTISGNVAVEGGGIFCHVASAAVIERSIVWGNCADSGPDGQAGFGSSLSFRCSLVVEEAVSGVVEFLDRQVSAEPLFCGATTCMAAPTETGDYTLAMTSPCLPERSPCGESIGALDSACDLDPVTVKSWGGIKAGFRAR